MARQLNAYSHESSYAKELKRDVLDVITNISPVSTPFMSGLGRSKATASLHTWNYETISRTSSQPTFVEGGDLTPAATAAPTLGTNYVQEFARTFSVSWKQQDSETIGGDSVKRAKALALTGWKLDVEYALINGSGMSGGSNSAWQLSGALNFIASGNINSYASLTTLTEAIFNDLAEEIYSDTDASVAEAYMGISLKRAVSAFTTGNTRNIGAGDRRLVNPVDVIETDPVSTVKLFAHRDMPAYKIMMIVPDAWKVAYLRTPEYKDNVAPGYAAHTGTWYGSLTLEGRDPNAGGIAVNVKA